MFTESVSTLPISLLPIQFYIQNEIYEWQIIEKNASIDTLVEDVAEKMEQPSDFIPDYFIRGNYANVNGHAKFYICPTGNWHIYITGIPKGEPENYKIMNAQDYFYYEDKHFGYLFQAIFQKHKNYK